MSPEPDVLGSSLKAHGFFSPLNNTMSLVVVDLEP
jgi:hypothetical protein